MRPYLEKPFTKKEVVEWLKVKAMSSSPSTSKKKEKKVRAYIRYLRSKSDAKCLPLRVWQTEGQRSSRTCSASETL
jgi:hypothetical protein